MATATIRGGDLSLSGLKKSRSRSAFDLEGSASESPSSQGTAAPLTPESKDLLAAQGRIDAALQTVMGDMDDVPFNEICHSGVSWNRKNFLIKLWRYLIVPTKELYLPFMTSGMPTNYLMVSEGRLCSRGILATDAYPTKH